MSDFVELTGLWETTSKAGKKYLSGSQGRTRYLVFKNENAEGKQPTHRLCVAAVEKREDAPTETRGDDDLPF